MTSPRTHPCLEPTCQIMLPPALLCCPPHWWRLPAEFRNAVSEAYRTRGSRPMQHLRAVRAARQWMKANPPLLDRPTLNR